MSNENLNNRSTALTPELLAVINASISAAVKEAMAGVGTIAEAIKATAITPEQLREANKPYVDPDKERRRVREKMKFKADELQQEKDKREFRDKCSHKYKTGLAAVAVVRNFPDRNPRGICMLCHEWFHPKEWRIDNPTETEPNGTAHIVDMHPKYQLVWDAINQKES